jgi:uncharacterized protein YcnI
MIWTTSRQSSISAMSTRIRMLVVLTLMCGLVAPFASPSSAFAAIAVGNSSNSATPGKAYSITVNVPSGVAAGEVMIAQIAVKSLTSTDVICTPSGWTSVVRNNKDSNISSQVFYRVAKPPVASIAPLCAA